MTHETMDPTACRDHLDLLLRGYQVSRILRLVADLGLADRIPLEGEESIDKLASTCGVLSGPLLRILRVLSALGIFRLSNGMLRHTPCSLLLRTDAPGSFHHAARFWAAAGAWNAWSELDAALYGSNPHQKAWGRGRFEYLREHPDESRAFDAFMTHFIDNRHAAIACSYDFSDTTRIVDVGGGSGETLRRILARFPGLNGVVFDRDEVIRGIPRAALLEGRIATQSGDFFELVPPGGDLYLLVRVLHDWSDDACLAILKNCRRVLKPGQRLLIGEHVLEPDPSQGCPSDYLIDLQMMVMFGDGRERTEEELKKLLTTAGFSFTRLIYTPSSTSLIEAVAA